MNAKSFEDNRFYGAFISKVNDDDTYDVYFPEDGTLQDNMSVTDIKTPLMSTKQPLNWNKYSGKVFADEGGVDEETGEYFEPGEFRVGGITTNNNFICVRLRVDGSESEEEVFDVGYVIKRIRAYEEE